MKKIAVTTLILIFGLSVQAQETNFRVSGRISYPCEYVYMYIWAHNHDTIDSCSVSSQGEYELTAFFEKGKEYHIEVIPYPLVHQKGFFLTVMAGEDIVLNIDSTTYSIPDVEGSPITQEDRLRDLRTNAAWERNRYLKAKLDEKTLSDSERVAFQDSLAQNEYFLNNERWFIMAEETISPDNHCMALKLLAQVGNVSKETMDSLIAVMKKKFPDNHKVQIYPDYVMPAPMTKERYDAWARRNVIIGRPAPPPWKEPRKKESYDLTALQVGDMIDTLSVESLDGSRIHLADIKSEYVLLEFWAGWCAPCIKEIPHLLEVQSKYGDELTILAISFDMDRSEWKKAIEKNGNGSFMHGYIGNDTQQTDLFMQRFGIKGIPASFLLDKDRRIVGANFRGRALEQMMEQLTGGSDLMR